MGHCAHAPTVKSQPNAKAAGRKTLRNLGLMCCITLNLNDYLFVFKITLKVIINVNNFFIKQQMIYFFPFF
jgi:hypothetical protein